MSSHGEEAMVPQWAAALQATVARIEARTDQIPKLAEDVEKLRASTVPVSEHIMLMERVSRLWDEVNQSLPRFREMASEHERLMAEREQFRGALTLIRWWAAAVSLTLVLLTMWQVIHSTGASVSIGGR